MESKVQVKITSDDKNEMKGNYKVIKYGMEKNRHDLNI